MNTRTIGWVARWFCALALFAGPLRMAAGNPPGPDSLTHWLQPVLHQTEQAFLDLDSQYRSQAEPLMRRLQEVHNRLHDQPAHDCREGYTLLWERIRLEDALAGLNAEYELKELRLRYRKGIEILKMLYEKILAMDHHFSSLKAQQELLNISNPHFYPEFAETRQIIDDRVKRKYGFALPEVLQHNPYLSATFSLVGLMLNSADEKERHKADPEKIACILDFTVRMHTDLNTVYFETGYLRDANLTLKSDCEQLFAECARQVGYTIPLESCRDADDWERLYGLLDNLVARSLGDTGAAQPAAPTPADPQLRHKTETNLLFALERINQFIIRYTDFVNLGNEYYKKFSKITETYGNDPTCAEQLPDAFRQLEKDIQQTLNKFNTAYRLPEVQGSKLKEMLFGTAGYN